MFGKLVLFLCYLFYAGMVYTSFVPDNPYLGYIDALRTMYIWIHIPLYIMITVSTFLLIARKDVLIEKVTKGMKKKPNWKDSFVKQHYKLHKISVKRYINILISISITLIAFLSLHDNFLGGMMLYGSFVTYYFVNSIKELTQTIYNNNFEKTSKEGDDK